MENFIFKKKEKKELGLPRGHDNLHDPLWSHDRACGFELVVMPIMDEIVNSTCANRHGLASHIVVTCNSSSPYLTIALLCLILLTLNFIYSIFTKLKSFSFSIFCQDSSLPFTLHMSHQSK